MSDNVTIKHSKAEYLCSLIAIGNSGYNDCVSLLSPIVNTPEDTSAASSVAYSVDSNYGLGFTMM